jgi:hypothetical protein
MTTTFPSERTEGSILLLRGHKILLDVHLAALYGVTTKRAIATTFRTLLVEEPKCHYLPNGWFIMIP